MRYPIELPEAQGYLKVFTYFGRDYRLKRGPGAGEYPKIEVVAEEHYTKRDSR